VLDVGAGSGRLLAVLAKRGWAVSGVDPSAPLVELAKDRLPEASGLHVARAEALPFPGESFDLVVVIAVLEYTDAEAAIRELARVLRPGGRTIVGLRGCRAPTTLWRQRVVLPVARRMRSLEPPPRRPLSLERTVALLTDAGLAIVDVESTGAMILPDPLDRLAPKLAYRVARRAERSHRLTRVFGTQRLVVARKPSA
jgi:ubiquinone/menaquinone biosynthesis C-methylase UbiE